MTGHDWKTVAKKIKEIEQGKEYPKKNCIPGSGIPQGQVIKYSEKNLSAVRIHEKLQEEDVKVGYSTVKDYIGSNKKRDNIFNRQHTLPGEEAQVDLEHAGYNHTRVKRGRPGYLT